jgi:hypothetical protein
MFLTILGLRVTTFNEPKPRSRIVSPRLSDADIALIVASTARRASASETSTFDATSLIKSSFVIFF